MALLFGSLAATGLIPIALALWTRRRTSLAHALVWALIAWTSWTIAMFLGRAESSDLQPSRYVALCLTGCAGIAVFGARRPHVAAWNFVVLSLLIVMLLPLAEASVLGTQSLADLRVLFVLATIGVSGANYVPTRLGIVALMTIVGCGAQFFPRIEAEYYFPGGVDVVIVPIPWLAWISWRKLVVVQNDLDKLWKDFCDGWGVLWSLRVLTQFNYAAYHKGWSVRLRHREWIFDEQDHDTELATEYEATLRAILRRFIECD